MYVAETYLTMFCYRWCLIHLHLHDWHMQHTYKNAYTSTHSTHQWPWSACLQHRFSLMYEGRDVKSFDATTDPAQIVAPRSTSHVVHALCLGYGITERKEVIRYSLLTSLSSSIWARSGLLANSLLLHKYPPGISTSMHTQPTQTQVP